MCSLSARNELRNHMKYLRENDDGFRSSGDIDAAPLFTDAARRQVARSYSASEAEDHSPFTQYGLLAGDIHGTSADPRIFFNVSAPSSIFICGSQGSGKSHTLSCLLENCLIPCGVNTLPNPLTGIVFHYDTFVSDSGGSPCEAAFLSSNNEIQVRVLCAPTNVGQIRRVYAKLPRVKIEELRINESDLNTRRMLDLMAVSSIQGGMPLYLHVVLRILRDLRIEQQATDTAFDYGKFKRALDAEALSEGQLAPLQQRLETLESFMVKKHAMSYDMFKPKKISTSNGKKNKTGEKGNVWTPKGGQLTIVDLSCPCVTAEMACSIFGICLSLFLEQNAEIGRVVALDEAHKYMTGSAECQSLTESLLSVIRLQRHIAARVFVSTQEPTISPHLLDLCSVTIVHRFTSPDWMHTLKQHIAGVSLLVDDVLVDIDSNSQKNQARSISSIQPLQWRQEDIMTKTFSRILTLRTGEALIFAPSAIIGVSGDFDFTPSISDGDEEVGSSHTNDNCFSELRGLSEAHCHSAVVEVRKPCEITATNLHNVNISHRREHNTAQSDSLIRLGSGVLMVRIRKRLTKDGGRSIFAT